MGKVLLEFGNRKILPTTNNGFISNITTPKDFKLITPATSTWTTLGSQWVPLLQAISKLDLAPQTVNLSYSFMLAGVITDPGSSVALSDKFGGPNHEQFVSEITEALNEWKAVFETIFSRRNGYNHNLILHLINLGDETGISVGSNTNQAEYTLPHANNIGHFRFGMHSIDGSGNVIAHAYSPESTSKSDVGGDCHFDSNDKWRLDTQLISGAISIKMVAVHEIGHSFGLGHDSNLRSIMYPSVSPAQNFKIKWPNGLINGHTGGGSNASGLSDIKAIYEIYKT